MPGFDGHQPVNPENTLYPETNQNVGAGMQMAHPSHEECARECAAAGFAYMGVQYTNECYCDNSFGSQGPSDNCGNRGDTCGTGQPSPTCGGALAVFAVSGPYAGCWDL